MMSKALLILGTSLFLSVGSFANDNSCLKSHVKGSNICLGDVVIYQYSADPQCTGGPAGSFVFAYSVDILKVEAILDYGEVRATNGKESFTRKASTLVKMDWGCKGSLCSDQKLMTGFSPHGNPGAPRFQGWKTEIFGFTPDDRVVFSTEADRGTAFVLTAKKLHVME
jgi:hypothetical protein